MPPADEPSLDETEPEDPVQLENLLYAALACGKPIEAAKILRQFDQLGRNVLETIADLLDGRMKHVKNFRDEFRYKLIFEHWQSGNPKVKTNQWIADAAIRRFVDAATVPGVRRKKVIGKAEVAFRLSRPEVYAALKRAKDRAAAAGLQAPNQISDQIANCPDG
jgi:hypothetical protein